MSLRRNTVGQLIDEKGHFVKEEAVQRVARCASCKTERPSSPDLPFFEARGPGTQDDTCRHCRYHRVAHEYDPNRSAPAPPKQCRHPFEPMTEGYDVDLFYCGCRGWS